MSLDATRWAWKQQGLRPLQKLILLALADRAGADDQAFPSQEQLIADTGAERKTIWQGLKALQEKALILDTGERKGATGQVVVWQLVGVEHRYDNDSENGRIPKTEASQKQKDSENGRIPKTDLKPSENGRVKPSENGIRNLPVEPTRTDQQAKRSVAPKKGRVPGQNFELFYAAYPKKKARAEAEKAWLKLNPDEAMLASIMSGLERAKQSQDWQKEGGQFIPHPATWLNGRRWEDELPKSNAKHGFDSLGIPGLI